MCFKERSVGNHVSGGQCVVAVKSDIKAPNQRDPGSCLGVVGSS